MLVKCQSVTSRMSELYHVCSCMLPSQPVIMNPPAAVPRPVLCCTPGWKDGKASFDAALMQPPHTPPPPQLNPVPPSCLSMSFIQPSLWKNLLVLTFPLYNVFALHFSFRIILFLPLSPHLYFSLFLLPTHTYTCTVFHFVLFQICSVFILIHSFIHSFIFVSL